MKNNRPKIVIKPKNAPPSGSGRKHLQPLPTQFDIDKKAGPNISWKKIWPILGATVLLVGSAVIFLAKGKDTNPQKANTPEVPTSQPSTDGPDYSDYQVAKDIFRDDQTLVDFLRHEKLNEQIVDNLGQQAAGAGLVKLEKGHEIRSFIPKNNNKGYRFYIYEMSPGVSIHLKPFPTPEVFVQQDSLEEKTVAIGIIIKSTLWDAVYDAHVDPVIIDQMEEAMKWAVDFYHLEPGDKVKLIFDQLVAGNEVAKIGQLKAIYFDTRQGEFYAFHVENMEGIQYMDEFGRPMRRAFLKSPVKYGRISSHYNKERIHPVLNEKRPHLGTDYAAPKGDPVFAVSDGVVEEARFAQNNGNYVKIRHDKVYESQYLHFDRFADGLKKGARVQQGQIIGFVGETGLATGPHVCFRFWKNGQQVDHLKEDINEVPNLSMREEDEFLEKKSTLKMELSEIVYQ